MPEFVNVEEKSASENAKSLKHMFKSKMKSLKEEKWKNKASHGQYPKILGTTSSSPRPSNKHQKLIKSNMWPASREQMQNVFST